MNLRSFSVESVTYRQEYISCGKRCRKCPNHGPYWYAIWWSKGKVRRSYIGKELPPGVQAPARPQLEPAPAPTMTAAQARKLLGLKKGMTYLEGHMRWQTERKFWAAQGRKGKESVLRLDAAWELVGMTLP